MEKATFKKKLDNYWYYYKIQTIIAIFVVIVLAILIHQCVARVEPDATIIIAGQSVSVSDDEQTAMQNYFSSLTSDVNGDGKKVVECSVMPIGSGDSQTEMAYTVKLSANLVDKSNIIYVFDSATAQKYVSSDSGEGFTKIADIVSGYSSDDAYALPVSKTKLASQSFSKALDGLSIYVRKSDTANTKAKYLKNINNQLNIIKKLVG
jgi:hypothetical protein